MRTVSAYRLFRSHVLDGLALVATTTVIACLIVVA